MRAVVERAAAALVAAAVTDGRAARGARRRLRRVLALCPDDRLTCVSSLDPSHFLEPLSTTTTTTDPRAARGNVPEECAHVVCARRYATRARARRARVRGAVGALGGRVDASVGGARRRADRAVRRGRRRVLLPERRLRRPLPRAGARERTFSLPFRGTFPLVDGRERRRRRARCRAQARDATAVWDGARNTRRLETLRKIRGYGKVPVVRNSRARPDEQLPDGSFKIADERPWKQAPGAPRRVYGEDGERDEAAGVAARRGEPRPAALPVRAGGRAAGPARRRRRRPRCRDRDARARAPMRDAIYRARRFTPRRARAPGSLSDARSHANCERLFDLGRGGGNSCFCRARRGRRPTRRATAPSTCTNQR